MRLKGRERGLPEFAQRKAEAIKEKQIIGFQKAVRAGISIAMGTDAGSPFNEHGGNLQEINLLVQNGLTPMEAVVAATKTAAEVLGLQDSLGTIEEGKMADLVVLEGDPLAEPSFFGEKGKISLVMKGGEIIFRKE